jgi:hypothetical protein
MYKPWRNPSLVQWIWIHFCALYFGITGIVAKLGFIRISKICAILIDFLFTNCSTTLVIFWHNRTVKPRNFAQILLRQVQLIPTLSDTTPFLVKISIHYESETKCYILVIILRAEPKQFLIKRNRRLQLRVPFICIWASWNLITRCWRLLPLFSTYSWHVHTWHFALFSYIADRNPNVLDII